MNAPIITTNHVSKNYLLRHLGPHDSYATLRDSLSYQTKRFVEQVQRIGRAEKTNRIRRSKELFWALRDISFSIQQGERVGIIGRNGAGKSTLLKILSRITEPSEGRITMTGRVASLLEVGTGFHPELTGRENIFLNGAILGMSKIDIKKKFDAIVAFAEVEQFLDTPVKRYSSGMYVRLAFAVAAHLEPEILIVDEVLAVGDAQFQKKCLGKMEEVTQEGRTVLFVSHNMAAIADLCNRAILLDHGRLIEDGPTNQVIGRYLELQSEPSESEKDLTDPSLRRNSRAESVFHWTKIVFENSRREPTTLLELSEPFSIRLFGQAERPTTDLRLGFSIHTLAGQPILHSFQLDNQLSQTFPAGNHAYEVRFDANLLAPGYYKLNIEAHGPETVDMIPDALQFSVSSVNTNQQLTWENDRAGLVRHPCHWKQIKTQEEV